MQGKIIKGIGGFYYVHVEAGDLYECKAKGGFRNQRIKPAVGDDVVIDVIDEEKKLGNMIDILPRKNKLIRPAVANVDQAIVIFALASPEPNYNLLDRFLIMMERQSVKSVICFNKDDLVSEEEARRAADIYRGCGYEVVLTNTIADKKNNDILMELIKGKTSVFAGPSGVGKSSILNMLGNEVKAKTGEISEKIQRGKHTTRHSELICVAEDTYIMDTPGFTSLMVEEMPPEELDGYFEEFVPYIGMCKYGSSCAHISEPGCRIKEELEAGHISRQRYDNYIQMYSELKNKRRW